MQDQPSNPVGQLPQPPNIATPQVPAATLSLETGVGQANGAVQQSVGVLMNTELSPYQMTINFVTIKEDYIAKTYGVTIE